MVLKLKDEHVGLPKKKRDDNKTLIVVLSKYLASNKVLYNCS